MRFIILGMATKEAESAVPPTAEQFAAIAQGGRQLARCVMIDSSLSCTNLHCPA